MKVYAPNTKMETPAARPSRPSVRFVAFDHAVTMRFVQIRYRTTPTPSPAKPNVKAVGRAKEISSVPAYSPNSFGMMRVPSAKSDATATWPIILPDGCKPRERWRMILMPSSSRPITPKPTKRNTRSRPDHDGPAPATSEPISQATTVARMMTTPPIVGVPRLVKCWVGPSWRMN